MKRYATCLWNVTNQHFSIFKKCFDFFYYKIDVFVIGLYYTFVSITECVIRLYYKIIKNVIKKNKNSKNKSEGSEFATQCVRVVRTSKERDKHFFVKMHKK